jgi:hypothetical protein
MTGRAVLTAPVGLSPPGWCSRAEAEPLASAPPIARSERRSSAISWRGVVPYGRSHGRLPAPGTRIEPGIITQKRLIETAGDGVRFTPNPGHGAAPQQLIDPIRYIWFGPERTRGLFGRSWWTASPISIWLRAGPSGLGNRSRPTRHVDETMAPVSDTLPQKCMIGLRPR